MWGDGSLVRTRSVCRVQRKQPECRQSEPGFQGRQCGFLEWEGYKWERMKPEVGGQQEADSKASGRSPSGHGP